MLIVPETRITLEGRETQSRVIGESFASQSGRPEQYMVPDTHLQKRLKRGDPGNDRLDNITKRHNMTTRLIAQLAFWRTNIKPIAR